MYRARPASHRRATTIFARLMVAAVAMAASFQAAAQNYPTRPITMVYPFPPGGSATPFTTLFTETGRILGQTMVVDFKPGAGSRLGVTEVMKAKPDGYTLAASTEGVLTLLPLTSDTFKVQPGKDYAALMQMIEYYFIVTSHSSLPFRDFQGLVAYAKANPGKLNFAGTEPGGTRYFLLERIKEVTGVDIVNVPYKSDQLSLPDRLSGITPIGLNPVGFKPQLDSGKMVALATTGPSRLRELPQVATLEESGYKGFTMASWFGLIAPAGTPPEIMNRLHAAFVAGLKAPEVVKLMDQYGFETRGTTPQAFDARIKSDLQVNTPVVKRLGLKTD